MSRTPPRIRVVQENAEVHELLNESLAGDGRPDTPHAPVVPPSRQKPDVIVLDLSRRSVLRAGAKMKDLASIAPVIVVTAAGDRALARRLLREGAFAYVVEPYDTARLLALIEAALRFQCGDPNRVATLSHEARGQVGSSH